MQFLINYVYAIVYQISLFVLRQQTQQKYKNKQLMQGLDAQLKRLNYNKNTIMKLHQDPLDKYPPIDVIDFATSNLNEYPMFSEMVGDIIGFNEKLQRHKNGEIQMEHPVGLYNLYENLRKRLHLLGYIPNPELVSRELKKIHVWISESKVKTVDRGIGNIATLIKIAMENKSKKRMLEEQIGLEAYRNKQRTAHSEFRPPMQRLDEFNKRQLDNPKTAEETARKTFFTERQTPKQKERQTIMETARTSGVSKELLSLEKSEGVGLELTENKIEIKEFDEEEEDEQDEQQPQQQQNRYKKPFTSDTNNRASYYPKIRDIHTAPLYDLDGNRTTLTRKLNDQRIAQQVRMDQEARKTAFEWSKAKSRSSTHISRKIESKNEGNRYSDFNMLKIKKINMHQQQDNAQMFKRPNKSENKLRKYHLLDPEDIEQPENINAKQTAFKVINKKYQSAREDQNVGIPLTTWKTSVDLQAKPTIQTKPISLNVLDLIEKQGLNNSRQVSCVSAQVHPVIVDTKRYPKMFLEKARDIENQIREARLAKTISTWSKYIQHTNLNAKQSVSPALADRQMSLNGRNLTSLTRNHKTNSFGVVLQKYNTAEFNAQIHGQVQNIKSALTYKGIPIAANKIKKGLNLPEPQFFNHQKMPKTGDTLMSNPWFPKTKPKKKKN